MHLDNGGRSDLDRCLLVGRENIACGSIVADLGNGVLANTQALNEDFAVFVCLKGLVIVRACYSKRETVQFSIRGSLNNFQRAFLCGVDKANACLVLYGIGLAVFLNGYAIHALVKHKALWGCLFTDKVFAVS